MEDRHTLGIDFGTTNSCICTWANGGIVVIPNGLGERTTPSVVIFENKNQVYVGEEILNHISKKNCVKIYEIKRLIGKKYSEIENIKNYFAFTVVKHKDKDQPMIKITFENGEISEYTPEEIACLIFKKLITNAENFLNQKITDVVITVPADFTDIQRHAVKFSAESISGIKVLNIINEPSAAALAYGFYMSNDFVKNVLFNFEQSLLGFAPHPIEIIEKYNRVSLTQTSLNSSILNINSKEKVVDDDDKHILVFDLGGGTYDVSIVEMNENFVETSASSGDQMLGGGDFDNKLMEFCINYFSEKNAEKKNIADQIKNNYISMQKLKNACEQTKKALSIKMEDIIFIEDFYEKESLSILITRTKFEELCEEIFVKLKKPLNNAIKDAKKKGIDKIDEIILVGGSSRIPKIKEILKEIFGKEVPINNYINPEEIVAQGAALCCEKLVRSNNELLKNFAFIASTQHSYGIEVEDGKMEVFLKRGSNYPSSVTKYFHNYFDNQISIDINVYEGEDELCKNNQFLAKFTLENIPKKKMGELIITVKFGIDTNQILKVSAFVAENNTKKAISIISDNPYTNEKKIIFEDLNTIEIDLEGKEKKLKQNMAEYSENFIKTNNEENKYKIIKNYIKILIEYLTFLQEKCFDIESNKYILLVEYLFKSYSYIFSKFSNKLLQNEKKEVEENILKYLKIISIKKPFNLKQIIITFESIKIDISHIFYSISIYCMEILKEKAKYYLDLKTKNSSSVAKSIYEECLNISSHCFKEEMILNLIDKELKEKYKQIIKECEKNIIILSIEFINEIQNTLETGKLFSNSNMDQDNLSALSFNIGRILKKINSIENLYQDKETLEKKSICLATIVKIEFSMKNRRLSLKNLLEYSNESIDIVDNKLGKEYEKKNWYNEIVDLRKQISNPPIKGSPPENEEKIREEFENKYLDGVEEFLKFLVEKYPYDQFNTNYDIIGEYKKNKKNLLRRLMSSYRNYNTNNDSLNLLGDNNDLTFIRDIILEYLGNIRNDFNS